MDFFGSRSDTALSFPSFTVFTQKFSFNQTFCLTTFNIYLIKLSSFNQLIQINRNDEPYIVYRISIMSDLPELYAMQ